MKKQLQVLALAIGLVNTSQLFASVSSEQIEEQFNCRSVLEESIAHSESTALLDRLIELENRVSYLREQNGHIERRTIAEARKKEAQLSIHIQRGQIAAAIDLYRSVFRAVEFGYVRTKQIREELQRLELIQSEDPEFGGQIESQHFFLSQELRRRLKEYGENYAEYIRARQKLEKLIDEAKSQVVRLADSENSSDTYLQIQKIDHEKFALNAEKVLDALQIKVLLSSAPNSGLRQRSISTKELHAFFTREHEAIEAHLISDLTEEQSIRRWSAIYPVLETFRALVYRLPTWAVRPTSLALGLSYNHYVREKYFPDIERLFRYRNNPDHSIENLYEELTKINAQYTSVREDEFLVTLARVKDCTRLWVELKQEAKRMADTTEDSIYDQYYARMLEAESRALKMGDLPLYFEGSAVDKKVVGAMGFITGISGAYYIWGQDLIQWANTLLSTLGH